MKNTHLSSVTALLLSLSFVVGILVSDLAGARLLTAAHAQTGSCGGQGVSATIVGKWVNIRDGAAQGIVIRNVRVDDRLIPFGVIPGGVRIRRSTLFAAGGVTAYGVVVSDGASTDGVVVSDGASLDGVVVSDGASLDGVVVSDGGGGPQADGVVVSDGGQCADGVVVSDGGGATAYGVVVSDGASVDGVVVSDGLMTATGGTLVGDGVVVSDGGGVTGSNLQLVGATLTARSASVTGVIHSSRLRKN